jgi:hypothetical protein
MVHLINDVASAAKDNGIATHCLILAAFEHVGDTAILTRLAGFWDREKWSRAVSRRAEDPEGHELSNKLCRYRQLLAVHGIVGLDFVLGLFQEVHRPAQANIIPGAGRELPPQEL